MVFGPKVSVVPFPAWITETLAIRGATEAAAALSPLSPPATPPATSFSPAPENASVTAPSRSEPWWVRHLRLRDESGSSPAVHSIPAAAFEALAREVQAMQHCRGSHRFPTPAPVALVPGTEAWVTKHVLSRDASKPIPIGYACIALLPDGQLGIINELHSAPLTPELIAVLAPVLDLTREAVEALPASGGWKLHLNFEHDRADVRNAIQNILERLESSRIIDQFKIGNADPGKEATVYIGHGKLARRVAAFIQAHAAHLLLPPAGHTLDDDVFMNPLVMGRFDVGRFVDDFSTYGFHGVPYLKRDMAEYWSLAKQSDEEKRATAWRILEYRYGTFFADGFIGARRPG